MWHGESNSLFDLWMFQDHFIHFSWRDLLSASVDDFFDAPSDEQITVLVEIALISSPKPTLRERCDVGIAVVGVTTHDINATNNDLANFTAGQKVAGFIH